jgi:MFS family permease
VLDSTALTGALRPFRQLTLDGRTRPLWASRLAEQLADWVFLVALLVTAWELTEDVAVVALLMLARLLPRAIIVGCCQPLARRVSQWLLAWLVVLRVPIAGALALIDRDGDLIWGGLGALAYGSLAALSAEARAARLPRLVPRERLAAATALHGAIERVSFAAGPLLCAALLAVWGREAALLAAALGLTCAAIPLWFASDRVAERPADGTTSAAARPSVWRDTMHHRTLLLLVAGQLAGALLATTLMIALVALVAGRLDGSSALYGVLVAVVGAGTLIGPLSVPRLLGHLPVALLVSGFVLTSAAAMVVVSQSTSVIVVAVVLAGIGVAGVTNDAITAAVTRRVVPEDRLAGASQALLLAVTCGQILGAALVVVLAQYWGAARIVAVVSVACAAIMALLLLVSEGRTVLVRRRRSVVL